MTLLRREQAAGPALRSAELTGDGRRVHPSSHRLEQFRSLQPGFPGSSHTAVH